MPNGQSPLCKPITPQRRPSLPSSTGNGYQSPLQITVQLGDKVTIQHDTTSLLVVLSHSVAKPAITKLWNAPFFGNSSSITFTVNDQDKDESLKSLGNDALYTELRAMGSGKVNYKNLNLKIPPLGIAIKVPEGKDWVFVKTPENLTVRLGDKVTISSIRLADWTYSSLTVHGKSYIPYIWNVPSFQNQCITFIVKDRKDRHTFPDIPCTRLRIDGTGKVCQTRTDDGSQITKDVPASGLAMVVPEGKDWVFVNTPEKLTLRLGDKVTITSLKLADGEGPSLTVYGKSYTAPEAADDFWDVSLFKDRSITFTVMDRYRSPDIPSDAALSTRLRIDGTGKVYKTSIMGVPNIIKDVPASGLAMVVPEGKDWVFVKTPEIMTVRLGDKVTITSLELVDGTYPSLTVYGKSYTAPKADNIWNVPLFKNRSITFTVKERHPSPDIPSDAALSTRLRIDGTGKVRQTRTDDRSQITKDVPASGLAMVVPKGRDWVFVKEN